ncbi:hypothetical protein ACFWY5_29665 [Nonomuraea sp. NPDC059007]|uniref:hypothetical protein n=1 Tax=Nonomuraea sp. NPDC059007 TaxID=3346692 RepID=UPI0036C77B00
MSDPFADPFADEPADEAQTTTPKERKTLSSDSDAPYTGTFKAGGGFDAPWLVVRAGSAAEYRQFVTEAETEGLFELTSKAAKKFAEYYGPAAKAGGGGRPVGGQRQTAPQRRASTPPPTNGPDCNCGEPAGYDEWKSQAGKQCKAWKCQKKIDDWKDPEACDFFQWTK